MSFIRGKLKDRLIKIQFNVLTLRASKPSSTKFILCLVPYNHLIPGRAKEILVLDSVLITAPGPPAQQSSASSILPLPFGQKAGPAQGDQHRVMLILKCYWLIAVLFSCSNKGSGCGSVGRAVACDTRDPQFKPHQRQNLIYQLLNRKRRK